MIPFVWLLESDIKSEKVLFLKFFLSLKVEYFWLFLHILLVFQRWLVDFLCIIQRYITIFMVHYFHVKISLQLFASDNSRNIILFLATVWYSWFGLMICILFNINKFIWYHEIMQGHNQACKQIFSVIAVVFVFLIYWVISILYIYICFNE